MRPFLGPTKTEVLVVQLQKGGEVQTRHSSRTQAAQALHLDAFRGVGLVVEDIESHQDF